MPTPLLTATPGSPVTYNPSMADTFSWVPVEGAGRPLFARSTYLTNASDISVSLSAENILVNTADIENLLNSQLGQGGFEFIEGGDAAVTGNFTTVQVVSTAKLSAIVATNTTIGELTSYELPVNYAINGPITSISLAYGAAIVYKLYTAP